MRASVILIFWLCTCVVGGMAAAGPALDDAGRKAILRNPAGRERLALGLILGFGDRRGLTAEGVEQALQVERAAERARMLAALLSADLDGDGAVEAAERDLAARPLAETSRARLVQRILAADGDADGTVTEAERAAAAAQAADAALDADDVARWRAVLAFDADADGAVTTAELHRGLRDLGAGNP